MKIKWKEELDENGIVDKESRNRTKKETARQKRHEKKGKGI